MKTDLKKKKKNIISSLFFVVVLNIKNLQFRLIEGKTAVIENCIIDRKFIYWEYIQFKA